MSTKHAPSTPNNPDRRPLRTVNEVADELNVSTRTVRRMIADGQLTARRVRGSRRIPDQELDRYRGG
jgi:excisionase family DNA binding protein